MKYQILSENFLMKFFCNLGVCLPNYGVALDDLKIVQQFEVRPVIMYIYFLVMINLTLKDWHLLFTIVGPSFKK